MVNKNGAQGTSFESHLTSLVDESDRLPKMGVKGEPDVWFYSHPRSKKALRFHVLAWKRLVKGKGKRRVPDGQRDVVVMPLAEFIEIMDVYSKQYLTSVVVQAKATERLNVTRVLDHLITASEELYG